MSWYRGDRSERPCAHWGGDGGKGRGKGDGKGKGAQMGPMESLGSALNRVQRAVQEQRQITEMARFFDAQSGGMVGASLIGGAVQSQPGGVGGAPMIGGALQSLAPAPPPSQASPELAVLASLLQGVAPGSPHPPSGVAPPPPSDPEQGLFARLRVLFGQTSGPSTKHAIASDSDPADVRRLAEEVRQLCRENERLRHGRKSGRDRRAHPHDRRSSRSSRSRSRSRSRSSSASRLSCNPCRSSSLPTRASTPPRGHGSSGRCTDLLARAIRADASSRSTTAAPKPHEHMTFEDGPESQDPDQLDAACLPEKVSPELRQHFFASFGVKSSMTTHLSLDKWLDLAGKRATSQVWQERLMGVGVKDPPAGRAAMLRAAFTQHMKTASQATPIPREDSRSES